MGEPKFTPGPWIAVCRGDNGAAAEGDVHQKAKWDADPFDSGFMRGEFKWPDACLIAAAPELYEALDACLGLILNQEMQDGFESQQGHMARAALAKARGETP